MNGRTLFDKVWDLHVVRQRADGAVLLHIDRHVLHDLSSPYGFEGLERRRRPLRNPELTVATADHMLATEPGRHAHSYPPAQQWLEALEANARQHHIRYFGPEDPSQGIVHVIAPELGIALPGLTLVCGDSHTCTVGALGAVAFGIGSSECEHVMATQCLVARKPRRLRITVEGQPGPAATAKDLALALIARFGADAGIGFAVEYAGSAVRAFGIEQRLTLCNMAIEMSARIAMVAPDDVTCEYVAGRRFAPRGPLWDRALAHWRSLAGDDDAAFDRELSFDASNLAPQVTWGTSPQFAIAVDAQVPDPANAPAKQRPAMERALTYMGLAPGTPLLGLPLKNVFIGSCTNSRISDLRAAAAVVRGRKVARGVRAIVVPGSSAVKRQAEAEALDRIFNDAGFEWHESGCSMCAALNADRVAPGDRCVATSNRNFEGRQGPGSRTHLASPATAAASAIAGCIADVRRLGAG
jgi:3-isopropylmalate/(R)-2-methylmalate dehydratase large subunit